MAENSIKILEAPFSRAFFFSTTALIKLQSYYVHINFYIMPRDDILLDSLKNITLFYQSNHVNLGGHFRCINGSTYQIMLLAFV